MDVGYIAIWRKIQNHCFYKEKRVYSKLEAWIDILLEVQFYEKPKQVTFGMTVLTRYYGESLKSVRTWASRWSWGTGKTHKFLKMLEKMEQIRYTNETVTSRITVLNYSKYDLKKLDGGTQAERKENASGTQAERKRIHNKKDKNIKKDISNSKELLVDADATTTGKVEVITKSCPHQEIILIYHDTLGGLSPIRVWDDTARGYLRARWREDPERQFPSWWKVFFIYVKNSPFLMGHNDRGWQTDLRWLVKPTNFAKVMNGNFHKNNRAFAGAMDFIEGDDGK